MSSGVDEIMWAERLALLLDTSRSLRDSCSLSQDTTFASSRIRSTIRYGRGMAGKATARR